MYSSLGLAPPRISGGRGGWNDLFKYFLFFLYNLQSPITAKKIKSTARQNRPGGGTPTDTSTRASLIDLDWCCFGMGRLNSLLNY